MTDYKAIADKMAPTIRKVCACETWEEVCAVLSIQPRDPLQLAAGIIWAAWQVDKEMTRPSSDYDDDDSE